MSRTPVLAPPLGTWIACQGGKRDRETRRLSFGSVANRLRPFTGLPPPPQVLDWLIPPGAQAILDLAAGTGVVTRGAHRARAARVIAGSSRNERMRRRCWAAGRPRGRGAGRAGRGHPAAGRVGGRGGWSRPAWHWLDPTGAVPEITRVLRPGGRLGVIWVSRDMRVPWVGRVQRLRPRVPARADRRNAG